MIKKAVFSYFNPDESFGNSCGFRRYSDFIFTTALSLLCASRHFKEVQFISSDWGVEMISQLGIPKAKYSNKLNELKSVPREFWAYGKLLAYCEQKEPFVHVDNDVLMWRPLRDDILNADLCFQSYEPFNQEGYHYYNMLRKCWQRAPVKPKDIKDNPVYDYAYNCGICGGNDLSIFEEWRRNSAEYIFAPENQRMFFEEEKEMLIHQNLFHEQYFLACLIKKHNMRNRVKVIHPDALMINEDCTMEHPRYTHLWGTTKREGPTMLQIRWTLYAEDRGLFNRVIKFCKKYDLKDLSERKMIMDK
jgi:hypothetical protein